MEVIWISWIQLQVKSLQQFCRFSWKLNWILLFQDKIDANAILISEKYFVRPPGKDNHFFHMKHFLIKLETRPYKKCHVHYSFSLFQKSCGLFIIQLVSFWTMYCIILPSVIYFSCLTLFNSWQFLQFTYFAGKTVGKIESFFPAF